MTVPMLVLASTAGGIDVKLVVSSAGSSGVFLGMVMTASTKEEITVWGPYLIHAVSLCISLLGLEFLPSPSM